MEKRERLVFLDIIKICCAILIYMRHSISMFGCSYGNLKIDLLICATTSPVMTCFFVVSGFSIYYNNCRKNLLEAESLKGFYIKRFITIFPTYFLVHILSYFFTDNTIQQAIYATPAELLGIQSMFGGLFGVLHSGATWFISSLLLGYFIYPLVQELLKMQGKYTYITAMTIFFTLIYSEVVVTQIFSAPPGYVNPVLRAMQFVLGAALCSAFFESKNNGRSSSKALSVIGVNFVLSCAILAFALYYNMSKQDIIVPIYYFLISLAMLISIRFKPQMLTKNRLIQYASSLSYYFFILQVFLWDLSAKLCSLTGWESNTGKLVISFTLCVILSIICMEFFDKHAKNILKKKLVKA